MSVLRYLPVLQIFYVFFLRRSVESAMGIAVPLDRWLWVTLAVPLLLVVYTWVPLFHDTLGRAYLPSFLLINTIYVVLEKYITLSWFIPPAQHELGVVLLTLKLWVMIFIVTLLLAWRYSRGLVLVVSVALCLTDGALSLPFMTPGTSLYSLTMILIFARLVFITSVSVGVQWLVERQREQRGELMEANHKLAQYAAATEQLGVSQERNRLARELHDTLAHSLSGVTVELQAVQSLWDVNPGHARHLLSHALQAAESGLTEVRRALQALRASPLEDLGLALAVRDLATSAAVRASLRLDLDLPSRLLGIAPEVEQCVYRVAQEGLANVVRHADATSLRVALHCGTGGLTLTITDDGRGFDPASVNGTHYGLRGLHERAEMLGASLHVASAPQEGTTIRLLVPSA
ncbi:sensor histidine kinase [Chloroflexales bacterium ZM16-3]|nr:sensor histidine kinase [Chloroflexales bacterium ZM16-3]